MSCNINFFKEIEDVRKCKGISTADLCAGIMSERTYYRHLAGEVSAKYTVVSALLKKMNIGVYELIIKSRQEHTTRDPGLIEFVYKLYISSLDDLGPLYAQMSKYKDENLLVQRFIDVNLYKFRYLQNDLGPAAYSKLLKKALSDVYYVEDTNVYKLYMRSEYTLLDWRARKKELEKLGSLIKNNDFCMAHIFSIIIMDNYLNVAIKKRIVELDEMKALYIKYRSMLRYCTYSHAYNKLDLYRAYIEKYSGNTDLMNKYLVKYINGIIIADSAKGIRAEFNELKKDFGIEDYKEFLVNNKKSMFNNPDSRFKIVKKVTF